MNIIIRVLRFPILSLNLILRPTTPSNSILLSLQLLLLEKRKKNCDLLRLPILLLNFVPLLTSNPVQVLLKTIEVPKKKKFKVDESTTPLILRVLLIVRVLRVPILTMNSYQVRALAFDTEDITARDINEQTKYQVHQSLFYIYVVATDYDSFRVTKTNDF